MKGNLNCQSLPEPGLSDEFCLDSYGIYRFSFKGEFSLSNVTNIKILPKELKLSEKKYDTILSITKIYMPFKDTGYFHQNGNIFSLLFYNKSNFIHCFLLREWTKNEPFKNLSW